LEDLEKTQSYRPVITQFLKYASLGLFTYLIYGGLCSLALLIGLNAMLAIVFGFAGATGFSFFFSNKIFSPDYSNSRNLSKALSRFIPAVLFNLFLVMMFNNLISRSFFDGLGSVLTAPLVPAVINFFVMKYLVFRV
jgi:putative flippase GtrA